MRYAGDRAASFDCGSWIRYLNDSRSAMAMGEPKIRWRVGLAAALTAAMVLIAISGLMKPLPNACIMTYMYPTYVPVPSAPDAPSGKYGLFLYHEGWKKIDFAQHIRELSGVPVLFIPGNGGSYKQVRSLAAESDRAYNGGPLEDTFYKESLLTPEEAGLNVDNFGEETWDSDLHVRDLLADPEIQGEYVNHLDWFAVDLEGEHSAMDGRILEEHTDYVVQAIHRILDQYKESLKARSGHKNGNGEILPTSVILVGHSMGGFVARAAVVHPELRKGAVETVVTLSSPHLLAPIAFQPSLGHFFSRINTLWRSGYEIPRSRSGRLRSDVEPPLSRIVVVSIPGGIHDYQVRSRMASLDGIVPATHSLTVGSPGMLNAWLSTEHQTILWCNQLVVQVAHALLKLIDKNTGQTISNPRTRHAIFIAKLRSALPQTFEWIPTADAGVAVSEGETITHGQKKNGVNDFGVTSETKSTFSQTQQSKDDRYSCPKSVRWESHEKDLHVDTSSVTVLAMDGRRRWLDIRKQASRGKTAFVLVTNLAPCHGVRVHLWPERNTVSKDVKSVSDRIVEITTKMVQLPAGPAPRQIEPGGQTEQAPPSGVLRLSSKDLEGFRYITISVAPRPTVSGRPPPATSMAVGQFFNIDDGNVALSPWWLFLSAYKRQDLVLREDHPLVMNISISISLGFLPLSMEVKTASCGISDSTLAKQQAGDSEVASLCKLRCFPPVGLVWDPDSGLEIIPNLHSQTIVSDSSPVLEGSRYGSQQTALILLVDPHCGYNITVEAAKSVAVSRFLLTHGLQIGGFMVAILLFALMRQARAWELDMPLPSVFACLERNLMFPVPFVPFCVGPLFLYFAFAAFRSGVPPPYALSSAVAIICYVLANGILSLLAMGTMLMFHATASVQVFLRLRWQSRVERWNIQSMQWLLTRVSDCFSLQIVRKIRARPKLAIGVVATVLVFFVHPALGLAMLLLSHTWCCHVALCSHRQYRGDVWSGKWNGSKSQEDSVGNQKNGKFNGTESPEDPDNNRSYVDMKSLAIAQLESFKLSQGLLLLHLTATCMLAPSLIAWLQRPKVDRTLPWFLDSVLSFGLILHGLYVSHGGADISFFNRLQYSPVRNSGLSFVYGIAGLYAYWAGLVLAPYRAFYALAAIGLLTAGLRFMEQRTNKGEPYVKRRHFHKHLKT